VSKLIKHQAKDQAKDHAINTKDMQDGQIGVIVDWLPNAYVGVVVQRVGVDLIAVGKPLGGGWPSFFDFAKEGLYSRGGLVKLFRPGDHVTIEI
jgi:hypothetical protein